MLLSLLRCRARALLRAVVCPSLAFVLLPALGWAQPSPPPQADLYGEPIVRRWVRASYAPEWESEQLQGRVRVRFVVDTTGAVGDVRVMSSTDPRFDAAATAAIAQWQFSPALEAGQPVPRTLETWMLVRPPRSRAPLPLEPADAEAPETVPVTPARERRTPDPVYPAEWLDRRIPGSVDVEFEILEDGQVGAIVVNQASHSGFVPAALAAVRQWQFRPALQGDLPVRSRQGARLEFAASEISLERGLVVEELAAHGIRAAAGDAEPRPWTQAPRLRRAPDPVFPYELAVAGVTGEAEAEFLVSAGGTVQDVTLRSASHAEFGAALVAAVREWGFLPARQGREAVAAALVVRYAFADPRTRPGSAAALWQRVLGGETISSARGLDRPLRPLYRIAPAYPPERLAEGGAGTAQLELVIDRAGAVRLVRVLNTSHPSFGYAAAVGVSQWCFEPPTRGGEPVDVRVTVPFNFAAP